MDKERYQLCTGDGGEALYDSKGLLLVFDVTDQKLMTIPPSEEVSEFFGLQHNMPGPSESCNQSSSFATNSASSLKSNSSSTQSVPHASWKDENAIRRLIYGWKEHQQDFKSGRYKSSEVWKKISILLQTENDEWIYTGLQCENKFKELKKKYIKMKDHNQQSGNSPMICKFQDELEDVLGDKPFVHPVALASNLKKRLPATSISGEIEDSEKDQSKIKKKEDKSTERAG